jgi:nucleoside diphosphate kinase
MTIERTLSIVKPDAVAANLIGKIYTKFEDDLMKHPLCVFHKDISSQHYLMCFNVNDNIKHDYESFVKSQYSKISMEGKRTIISFFKLAKDHAVTMVLYKDARLKKKYEEALGVRLDSEAELSSVLDLNGIETFKSSYIVESKSPLPKL